MRIAETRNWPTPVRPFAKGAALAARHFFAIVHQARASATGDHAFVQARELLFR
jgi:hypothetical protein